MQNKTAIMAIVGVAVLASVISFNLADLSDGTPSANDSAFIMGHVTATLTDENGYIKAYRQTDNMIVNTGLDIIANQVFSNGTITNNTAAGDAYATSGGTVKAVALGTGGDNQPQEGQDDLTTYLSGCTNKTAGDDGDNSYWDAGTDNSASTSDSVVVVSNTTFNGSDGCNIAVDEVGILTRLSGTQDGRLFAIQEFTEISVGASDTLTINWDITFADN